MKRGKFSHILLAFIILVIVSVIGGVMIIVVRGGDKPNSQINVMSEIPTQQTDILLSDDGTHGYIHGVWGFGENISTYSNLLEQEPGCGVRIGLQENKKLKVLTFGKLARVMEQERDDTEERDKKTNLLKVYPALERIEVEEGNPYLYTKEGVLYSVNGNEVLGYLLSMKKGVVQ